MSQPTSADAVAATNRHYDLPAEVFRAFLGIRMKYTCGLFAEGSEDLDRAQEAKLEFIADALRLRGGEDVLDIGCGWGSLAVFLAERYGCRVLAVAPSRVQIDYLERLVAERRLHDTIRTRCSSVENAVLEPGSFAAVAMVGVIEHIPDHRAVLAKAARSLRLGGHLYVSASCHRSEEIFREYSVRPASRHVLESVFGFGMLRPLSDLLAGAEDAGLSLSRIADLTPHYHRTIAEWIKRTTRNRAEIEAVAPGLTDELLKYFTTTNAGWGYTTKHYAFTGIRSRMGETVIPF